MKKRLTAIGNSLGIVIEKPILELLGIDRETEIEMTTDGVRLVLEPVRRKPSHRVASAVERSMTNHAPTLRRLADLPQSGLGRAVRRKRQ